MNGISGPRQALAYLGNLGSSLPAAIAQHRGNFYWKRANATEDELYAGMRDSSGVMQLRRLLTKTYADTLYLTETAADLLYEARKSTDTGWTAAAGAAMGVTPGSITQAGAEYTGRVIQDTGASGTVAGILWTITFANNRGNSNYNVFLNPQNAETARCQLYAINTSGTQFTIRAAVAPNVAVELRVGWLIEDRTP